MKKYFVMAMMFAFVPTLHAQEASEPAPSHYTISATRQAEALHQMGLLIDARLENLLAQKAGSTVLYPQADALFQEARESRQNFFDHLFFAGAGSRLVEQLIEWESPWPIHYPLVASHASYYLFGEPLVIFSSQNRIYSFNQIMLWAYQSQLQESDSALDPMIILLRFMQQANMQGWTLEETYHEFIQLFPLADKEQSDLEQLSYWLEDIQLLIEKSDELLPTMQHLIKERRINTFYQDIINQAQDTLIEQLINAYQPTPKTLFQMQFNQDVMHFNHLVMQEFNARFEASGLDASIREQELEVLDFIILAGFLHSLSDSVQEHYTYLYQFFSIRELVFILLEFSTYTQEEIHAIRPLMQNPA